MPVISPLPFRSNVPAKTESLFSRPRKGKRPSCAGAHRPLPHFQFAAAFDQRRVTDFDAGDIRDRVVAPRRSREGDAEIARTHHVIGGGRASSRLRLRLCKSIARANAATQRCDEKSSPQLVQQISVFMGVESVEAVLVLAFEGESQGPQATRAVYHRYPAALAGTLSRGPRIRVPWWRSVRGSRFRGRAW